MRKKALTNVDLAWLRMEEPNNLMVITCVMTVAAPIDLATLKAVTTDSLLRFDRFRQRVVLPDSPLERAYWQDDPDFHLDRHVETVRLLKPAGHAELEEMVGSLMRSPLPYDHPLWRLYLVEDYQGGSAVIGRLHHAIADGIALMYVVLSMASEDPQAAPLRPAAPADDSRPGHEHPKTLPQRLDRMAELAGGLAGKISDEAFKMLIDPKYARKQIRLSAAAAMALGRLVLRPPDPPTVFKGHPGMEKRAAWSLPLALDEVKFIGRALDGTVNDILLTAVAGALGRYSHMRSFSTRDLNIRGIIPVNLRPLERAAELGNAFGMVFLSLPLGIEDPLERLRELKRRMDQLKSTPEAAVAFGVLGLLGAAPELVQDLGVSIFDTKGSAVMTNVPGPQKPLYLAGRPVRSMMAWVPSSGRVSLGVSIISYNNQVWLGIASDRSLVDNPQRIIEFFNEEWSQMLDLARNGPLRPLTDAKSMLAALDRALMATDELLQRKDEAK